MNFRIFFTSLSLLLSSLNTFSAAPFIKIKRPAKVGSLASFQIQALNQMSIEIIIKHGKHQLFLNKMPEITKDSEIEMFELRFEIKKDHDLARDTVYDLTYKIHNLKNNTNKRIVRASDILGRRFLYHSRFLLYQLFFGKKYVEKNKKMIEKEAQKDQKTTDLKTPQIRPPEKKN